MNLLAKITNQELEFRLKDLVHKERKLLHIILEHINEVEMRTLYLQRAYSSMYEYLTKELGYSGSAAMRRMQAARLLREVPVVASKIEAGTLNLSQINELSRMVKEAEITSGDKVSCAEKLQLVEIISGKTQSETQKEVATFLNIQPKEIEIQRTQRDESIRLEITLTKEQFEKLKTCKDQAAHLLEQGGASYNWADLIEVLSDQFLKRKNPDRCQAKQLKTTAPLNFQAKDSNSEISGKTASRRKSETTADAVPQRENKMLTPKTTMAVLKRDQCCQFMDPFTQRKCQSTFKLQVDHRKPKWAGGNNSQMNLQTLCAHHNRYKYQREANIKLSNTNLRGPFLAANIKLK